MPHDRTFDPAHAERLERPERVRAMPAEKIVALAAPKRGMTIADVGCGTGYCLMPLVEAVGGQGTFYAVDAQPAMLDALRRRIETHPLASLVTPVLTPEDRLDLPDASVDLAILCTVWHELTDRRTYARELHRVLRSGGRLVLVDWRPLNPDEDRTVGPPSDHRITATDAMADLEAAGFGPVTPVPSFEVLWSLIAARP
jgi:SAM-dependent methyltransferase